MGSILSLLRHRILPSVPGLYEETLSLSLGNLGKCLLEVSPTNNSGISFLDFSVLGEGSKAVKEL
jgi:hypothetical protein